MLPTHLTMDEAEMRQAAEDTDPDKRPTLRGTRV